MEKGPGKVLSVKGTQVTEIPVGMYRSIDS